MLLLAGLVLPTWAVQAHEGHDHGPAEPAVPARAAPRAAAESEDFELVAVLEGEGLTLYLDRHASNEPVAGARLEVDSGALKAVARARGPGVYTLADPLFGRSGRHPLTVTVQADETLDLLAATLVVPEARPAAATEAPRWPAWQAAGAVLLLGLALAGAGAAWRWRRRKT